jgi:CHASE2 domain-containing sensor protein
MITAIASATISKRDDGPPPEFLLFMGFWVALALSSFLFFHFNRNAALKRRIWPAFILAIGLIFGGFVYFIMGQHQPQVLYLMVPAIIVISFLNFRATRFCDACGKTLHRQPIFSRTQFCPHCGSELK